MISVFVENITILLLQSLIKNEKNKTIYDIFDVPVSHIVHLKI